VSDTVCILFSCALDPTAQAHQESNHRADQKHDEKDFRDAGCADSDSTEAEKRGNQCDNEENNGIVKHVRTSKELSSSLRVAEVSGKQTVITVGARRR
jgi:hypothetical protein